MQERGNPIQKSVRNLVFNYSYRDADNYKRTGLVIFKGTPEYFGHLNNPEFLSEIQKHLSDGEYFVANQIGIPEIFLWNPNAKYDPDDPELNPEDYKDGYLITESDHCFHEFNGLEETEEKPTDFRTPGQFLADLKKASTEGWQVFLPASRSKKAR
jgi:hypothetical protein